ncbi:hypothetical protein IFM89_015286, partial [Coptis chinensis]
MKEGDLVTSATEVITKLQNKHNRYKLGGIPCVHAIAVIRPLRPSRESWSNLYFHAEAFKATYAGSIYPFDNEEDWGKVIMKINIYHHLLKEKLGDQKNKDRIRDEDEERASSTRKCTLCNNKPGHNQRTCPERPGKQSKNRKRNSKSKDTGQVPTTSGTRGRRGSRGRGKGSRGGRGGIVGSAKVNESQVSQQVNASQTSEEPLNESQASARPPTRGKGSRGTRGSRGGQSRHMYNYFENPTSYTHQPASRATNESSVTGQSR